MFKQRLGNPEVPEISALSISSISDYHAFEFPGKEQQREQVLDLLDQQGFIPDDLIEQEVDWFYNSLGIDDLFFSRETPQLLANIIHSLYASKLESFAKSNFVGVQPQQFNIKNRIVTAGNHAIFMESNSVAPEFLEKGEKHPADLGGIDQQLEGKKRSEEDLENKLVENPPYELDEEIDELFLDCKEKGNCRLVSFTAPESELKLTFVYESQYEDSDFKIDSTDLLKGNIDSISDTTMAQVTSVENKKLYGLLIKLVQEREGPVIRTTQSVEDSDEIRMLVAYKRFTTKSYFSAINSLFHYYKLKPAKIYSESFRVNHNGSSLKTNDKPYDDIIIFSIYLKRSQQAEQVLKNDLELSIKQVEREASLLYAIPNHSFTRVSAKRRFSPQEAVYAHVAAIFINHFINRLGSDYQSLLSLITIKDSDTTLLEVISNLKRKLRNETLSQESIIEALQKHYKVVSKLYKNFANVHYAPKDTKNLEKTLSYQRLEQIEPFKNDQEFESFLNKFIPNDSPDYLILQTLNLFNKSILKTNFFITRKVAISFRLKPELVMPKIEYPETPYGLFFVVGNTFKGFHIRFRDVARGGIRIVCSRSQDIYESNSKTVIDENYQLASTQQKKNKDIPEGGSKGVILLNPGLVEHDQTFIAFSQYVDAMIDILIRDPLKEKYVDLLEKEEILFFGPDEGSAGFVDWATNHARSRNCPWWKSFLTGKSPDLGGIPHDEYGMTSLGVRSYVNELYETLGLQDTKVAKFQTGGPDGDLGSNEILLSTPNETYVGLLDGSGVLCDPEGIDKPELVRLAHERKMIKDFDKSKLSASGFFVSVDDMDVMLPNGSIVANGTTFRNTFHTQIFNYVDHVDVFVPCGGRPNSINLNNLHYFVDEKTDKCKIPYIVEGANLFIAQPAKLALEAHGCVLFKDASANKGGVTSSSLEVLASLALSDDDFVNKFVATREKTANGVKFIKSPLYEAYVNEAQKRIGYNARQEFGQLWKINQETGTPISELSNVLSQTINKLNDDLVESEELWLNDLTLRNYLLLEKIIPQLLIDVAGKDDILKNIPENYLKVLLSSYLSSSYVYKFGIDVNIGKFLEFIGELKRDAEKFYQ
ncbi:NAD-specific glutamate dehydrogenase [Nakaseomyces bracarensis]|uniref:NAD-specific glutamate dehydrogenase n=1 Tax=Nakaseomyces bracarensis TaxID=273131 RepID=A0ABR4NN39_9SACH